MNEYMYISRFLNEFDRFFVERKYRKQDFDDRQKEGRMEMVDATSLDL